MCRLEQPDRLPDSVCPESVIPLAYAIASRMRPGNNK